MASPKVAPELLETLIALSHARELGREAIQESIFLERTVAAPDLAAISAGDAAGDDSTAGAIVAAGKQRDASVVDESDLAGLPRRRLIEPGGAADADADYRLVGAIGRGGTGIVFQAHQRAVNREVAIKVLRNYLRADRAARLRFLTEARTVGALDHPNVIALHELAIDDEGHPFYSMKRIDGTAWSEVLQERTLEENLTILLGVADATRYAHSRGIIHRDIKPANVMLGRYGEVLVADWGLALPHPISEEMSAGGGSIGGTPAYMAPEIASGALDEIGPHTDVYLLGATLFHLLSGFPPHDGDNLVECICNAADNNLRATDVQSELMDIALIAMATDPADRYASVGKFQKALREYQQHQESIALLRRATRHAQTTEEPLSYERLSLAVSLAREALELWPENRRAKSSLRKLQQEFAQLALDQDDLDLALSLLEAAGETQSDLADKIRQRRRLRSAQIRREERYSTLFANSPDAVLVSRLNDGTILDANDTFLRMFVRQRDEVVGLRVAEIKLWESPERRVDFIKQIRDSGKVDNFETTLQDANGRKIPVLISARQAVLDDETLIVAHTRDITLRREAENELRRSQSRLREVQTLANLGTWEVNLETGESKWSEETFRISGLPPNSKSPNFEEYLAMVHPADRERTELAIRNATQSGAAYQLQIRHRRPDGSYNTTIARGQPIVNQAGKVVELFGSVLDITDRRLMEDQLKQQASYLQAMLDYTDRPLLALERDGTLVAAAASVLKLLGRKTCCMRREFRFEPEGLPTLAQLQEPSEVDGQFSEDGRLISKPLRLLVDPQESLLRCEIISPTG